MRIVITSPSLDENENVSGISTVVRQIICESSFSYFHFVAGKKDSEERNLLWLLRQLFLPFKFYLTLKKVNPQIVHINTALNPLSILRDLFLCLVAKISGKSILIHVHGGKFLTQKFEKRWLEKLTEKMLEQANLVLVLSESEKKVINQRWKGIRIEVLQNAVSSERFSFGNKKRNSIAFLGRMHEAKGLMEIIEAFREIRELDFHFSAYGKGKMQDIFVKQMREILGNKFNFGGVISGDTKIKILSETDILILPSRYGEGLPMAILEAMACGCIVIASDIASISIVIQDGVNGFLIEPKSPEQLIQKLRFILEMDESTKSRIRANARKTVESSFDLEKYIRNLEKIYEKVAK